MNVRKITSNELMETRNISALCFEWSHDTKDMTSEAYFENEMNQPRTAESAYWDNTWATFTEEGAMMGCLSIPNFMVEFDGAAYKMGGIGAVCTYPQYRNQGVIREIFNKALPDLYERDYAFSYLYAFSEAFYRKFGYEPTCHSTSWTFDMRTIPSMKYTGSFELYREENQLEQFSIAYELFASSYNMCVHRGEFDWKNLKAANPFKENKSAYLYKDATGNPVGYIVLERKIEGNVTILHCSEMVFDSFQTLKVLLSFAKSFQADYSVVRFLIPSSLDLRYFCTDYSQSNSKIEKVQNGMARVVNVPMILKGAKYRGTGAITLRIKDTIISENEKDYSIEFIDGKCTKLIESPINDEKMVDITMSINQFSAAIIGMYDVSDFSFLEFVAPYKNVEELSKVFYKKGCWINNYF